MNQCHELITILLKSFRQIKNLVTNNNFQLVCPAMRFVILHPFDLGKVLNDAEFNGALLKPFRYPKFFIIFLYNPQKTDFRKLWKFKFLHFKHFYVCFLGNKGHCFRIFRLKVILNLKFQLHSDYGFPDNRENTELTGKSGKKFFFSIRLIQYQKTF